MPWRSLECLLILIEARGAVVSKEELQSRIWKGALIEDSNVSHAVTSIRKALDPAPAGDSYVLTVPRAGYRLTVPVEEGAAASPAPSRPALLPKWSVAWLSAAAILLCLVVAAGFVGPYLRREGRALSLVREGLLYSRRGIPSESVKAVSLFEQALLESPGYPPARAALAENTARFSNGSAGPAVSMARDAIRADPRCDECMAILGYILMTREWEWEESGRHLRQAIQQNPNDVQRRLWYGQWLSIQGRFAEAQYEAEQAIRLDPTRPHARALLAGIHYFAGQNQRAIQEAHAAIAMNQKHYQAYLWLERSYMLEGRDVDVIGVRAAGTASWSDWTVPMERAYSDRFQNLLSRSGRTAVARAFIGDVSEGVPLEVNRYNRALWNVWIGENQQALDELEAAMSTRPFQMVYAAVETAFVPLHPEPRFQELVRRIGLSHALQKAQAERAALANANAQSASTRIAPSGSQK